MKNCELRITDCKLRIIKILCVLCFLCGSFYSAGAQSTNQSYPTAVTAGEISGQIAARDIGDARLTNYFYAFAGRQGDVFINVQTSNFNGDIDIFTASDLKPLTKITIYADDSNRETGRVVYLRQPAKLILRVEGRTPNDDAATFKIKFAGSFEPVAEAAENPAATAPQVKSETQSDVRVNSVGTIIEVKPKPQPKETVAKKGKPRRKKSEDAANGKENTKENASEKETADAAKDKKSETSENTNAEVKVTNSGEKTDAKIEKEKENPVEADKNAPAAPDTENAATPEKTPEIGKENSVAAAKEAPVKKTTAKTRGRNSSRNNAATAVNSVTKNKAAKVKEPNPLENVHLVILLKDGTKIERAMSEVVRFAVVRGVLTVVATDGSINHYRILDVAKMTVE